MEKLLLIDGSNLIFRAYYASEKLNIKTLDNRPANAIKTLISMINKIIEVEKPSHVFIAHDMKSPTFRHQMYSEYKAGRSLTPQNLKDQFPMSFDMYDAMEIKHYGVEGYEADDLIATYAKLSKKQNIPVKIVTGDKDLLQLVEDGIEVFTPKMGFSKECNYNDQVFQEKFDFMPERFIEYKALVGDKSDNIIGVEKIGDKTARKLILQYPNIDAIINAAKLGEIKGKVGENIVSSIDAIKLNIELVTLIDDVKLEMPIDQLKFDTLSNDYFFNYLQEMGFTKLASDFAAKVNQKRKRQKIDYQIIEEFSSGDHASKLTAVYTQTLSENYFQSEKLGFGISSETGNFYLPIENITNSFADWLKSDNQKITFDLKRMQSMYPEIKFNNFIFDSFLATSLIEVKDAKSSIDFLMNKYGVNNLYTFEEVYKVYSNPKKPEIDLLSEDIATKAFGIKETYHKICDKIIELKLDEVLYKIEMPLSYTLSQMEVNGIVINQKGLIQLKKDYQKRLLLLEYNIREYTDININSTFQLAELLFDQKMIPTKGLKRTSKGYSTDVDNLQFILDEIEISKEDNQFISKILDYRLDKKILSTYINGLQKHILMNNEIHPLYHQLLSETGRLSTKDPSIQNIPIQSKEGKLIRELFVAKEGYKIVALDYSQIELRIMAHISQDPRLIKAFKNKEDIHSSTAQAIFNNSDSEHRSKAKAINFGIIYGMSKYGLSKQVDLTVQEAEEFINLYFKKYPNIQTYINQKIKFAIDNGYVKTMFGRIREIDNLNTGKHSEKEHAKRMAINTPIQGTSADLIKLAMIDVDKYIKDFDIKMIMQIHDELVFEIPEKELDVHIEKIKLIMENIIKLDVPLKVDAGIGNNWLEVK